MKDYPFLSQSQSTVFLAKESGRSVRKRETTIKREKKLATTDRAENKKTWYIKR